ncbi:MAG: metallophosphoesterase [Anaerolineae bacterium]|nr:metallophosphoesterase [Anaerolineae bacterium]
MDRVVDLVQGNAFVVTDLHGAWQPYVNCRDHFIDLYQQGLADTLIFLGDILHGYGPPEEDYSLAILWDIMQLQADLGSNRVIMLLGNHELPHIYGITLSKGDIEFTPRFEHALGEYRSYVIEFLMGLPFCVRTIGGTMLTHAGAVASVATPEVAGWLLTFSHQKLLDEADRLLNREDVSDLIRASLNIEPSEYDSQAYRYLAVNGPDDPRYYDLLRGFIVGNLSEWQKLWDFFFNQCEMGLSITFYRKVLERFLEVYSTPGMQQHVLVTGHMAVQDGYAIVAEKQLRLASWSHSTPKEAGCYLLFDVEQPIETASDLIPHIQPLWLLSQFRESSSRWTDHPNA